MGITKKMQLEKALAERCEDCVHWISPGRAEMDGLMANICSKCGETVFEHNNCEMTNMADNHYEYNEPD